MGISDDDKVALFEQVFLGYVLWIAMLPTNVASAASSVAAFDTELMRGAAAATYQLRHKLLEHGSGAEEVGLFRRGTPWVSRAP